ncbi:MAG TPA: glycoside hydrolase family 88 protein [Verrucomicrobiae bacterium]|nr:glycoside hydrolase family 88 protein [Verrucomicrobiae bacterium]
MRFHYFPTTVVLFCLAAGFCGCRTTSRSDEISNAQIRDVIARVARRQIRPLADGDYPAVTNLEQAESATPPAGIAWNYPWGVALFGMERVSEMAGNSSDHDFVVEHNLICASYYHWLAGLENQFGEAGTKFARGSSIKGLMTLGNLDSCGAMGNEMIESMMRSPDKVSPEEREVVDRIANWVVHKQDRLPDGTLWRSGRSGGTVWPDDLYMGGVFLVRFGIYQHDPKFIDDAAEQIIHQAALEQDSDGLWFHGYFVAEKMHAPFKWGRGNGWAMVTMVETLSAMDPQDPLRPKVLEILRRQIEGLKRVQAPDGAWRQVLDKPELWEETSCTGMFAYGIARAVNRGWIGHENMAMARKAFAAVARHVNPNGAVSGTCQGTNIGTDLNFYISREHPADDPHGWGPVMLAGTEILRGKE